MELAARWQDRSREGWLIEIAGRFIQILAVILMVAVFIRIMLLWVGMDTRNPVVIFLHEITEPILVPIRRFIPPMGMLDLSPLMAIILLLILSHFVTSLLA
ncbi:MAG: YggT family protein [Chloroflexi bacterium]|nr:YggT family protein [Chloroflexota bacterium]